MANQITFYTWRKCSTCRNAKKALDNNGVDVEERDFFETALTRDELSGLVDAIGIDDVFSWRSPSAKGFRQRRDSLTEDDLISAMLAEPRLIRRPIVVSSGAAPIVGFNAEAYAALKP